VTEVPVFPVLPVEPVLLVEPVFPVEPVSDEPDVPESPDDLPDELEEEEPADPEPVEPVPPEVVLELAPGCSWATATPIRVAAPMAPSTVARVARRSQAWARSRVSGVWVWRGRAMSDSDLISRIALHPSTPTSTVTQGALWACCDIVPGPAGPESVSPRYDHGARRREPGGKGD
jgi:hypothetical protein